MTAPARPRSIKPLIAILLISLAPVVFALLAYYVPGLGLRPQSSTRAGQFIEPQRDIPPTLALRDAQGQPFDLASLKGKWVLMSAGPGACPESCARQLYVLRNSHASQGKNVDRLERVWFVTDHAPAADFVEDAYKGTRILRGDTDALARWLAPDASGDAPAALARGMWVLDPLGHLMMVFPDTDKPEGVRDDIRTLLKNSHIG